ncbi:angiotensin-converting enzyme [Trichonephila clavipes]|nr:angiotensin-converting enzyme [Trichonephila clavipes]
MKDTSRVFRPVNSLLIFRGPSSMFPSPLLRYQGVCPPVKRTEKHFDIGAKYHIAAGVEYNRYLFSNILQFQIHEILCSEINHEGPLHECNIYKQKKAGELLA